MCCNRDQDFQAKIFLDPCVDNHNSYPIFCLTKAEVFLPLLTHSLFSFPNRNFVPKPLSQRGREPSAVILQQKMHTSKSPRSTSYSYSRCVMYVRGCECMCMCSVHECVCVHDLKEWQCPFIVTDNAQAFSRVDISLPLPSLLPAFVLFSSLNPPS